MAGTSEEDPHLFRATALSPFGGDLPIPPWGISVVDALRFCGAPKEGAAVEPPAGWGESATLCRVSCNVFEPEGLSRGDLTISTCIRVGDPGASGVNTPRGREYVRSSALRIVRDLGTS